VIIFSYGLGSASAVTVDAVYVNSASGNDSWDGYHAVWNGTSGPKASILSATNTVNNGGVVKIANGLYTGTNNQGITINKNMTIKGESQKNTVINGSGTFWLNVGDVNVIISDLTLNHFNSYEGGAIYNSGNLTLININFNNNRASQAGGALYNTGYVEINNCSFCYNSGGQQEAGAIFNTGLMNIIGSNFYYNSNRAIINSGNMKINFCRLIGNRGLLIDNYLGTVNVGTVNATMNWWGDNQGPNGKISGFIVDKWMVLRLMAVSSSVNLNTYSKIFADLRYDNVGNIHTEGYLPNGMYLNFLTTLGYFTGTSSTVNGIARTYLKSGSLGHANVTVKLDDQNQRTSVKIIDTVPPKVTSTTPKNNSIKVLKTIIIAIKFSENIKTSTYFNNIVIKNMITNKNLILSRTITGNTLYIKTSAKTANTIYQVIIPKSSIKDYNGNNLATNYSIKLRTGA
jgi:autotransporter family porin